MADVIAGINPTKSVAKHYNTRHPKQVAHQIMHDPVVQENIRDALLKAGITVERRAEKLSSLLDAEDNLGPNLRLQLETEKHIADLVGDKTVQPTGNLTLIETLILKRQEGVPEK